MEIEAFKKMKDINSVIDHDVEFKTLIEVF